MFFKRKKTLYKQIKVYKKSLTEYCCKGMEGEIEESAIQINKRWGYFLIYIDTNTSSTSVIKGEYCPFCGLKVKTKWEDVEK